MTSIMHVSTQLAPSMEAVLEKLNSVILDKDNTLRLAFSCLLAQGHLLLEDIPGTGKTVMAYTLAKAAGLEYRRVQFTNDLLPADITGVSIFDRQSSSFTFHEGPIFTQLLLADEINRATPKSQSALLEAMEERQVSIEGETYKLPKPFFVIATQNPLEQQGVYPLPEAQLDRFLMRLSLGYVSKQAELEILGGEDPRKVLAQLTSGISGADLLILQAQVEGVKATPALLEYIHALLDYTRHSDEFIAGLSTRAGMGLLRAARAWAFLHGQDRVLPRDVQAVFPSVAAHRLISAQGGSSCSNAQATGVLNAVAIV